MQFKTLALLAAVGGAVAQRPSNTSMCDYYTTALFMDNNATNQYTLLTAVVNTAVIGNFSAKALPNMMVPGILAPGQYKGVDVNLLPYFDGGLASSNRGGSSGVAVNFLDDGGAVPLTMYKPANGTSSNQYMLLTHLYEYFGGLLGCSMMGQMGFPAYGGQSSQYKVHRFMALNSSQVGYFITQVGMSAASFGVTQDDVTLVGNSLTKAFDYKCSPPAVIIPSQPAELQSICTTDDCMTAPNATCSSYAAVVVPAVANATLAMGLGSNSTMSNGTMSGGSGSPSGTSTASGSGSSSSSGSSTGSGSTTSFSAAAAFVGMAAMLFAL